MEALKGLKIEDILFVHLVTNRLHSEIEQGSAVYDAWKQKIDRHGSELDVNENYREKSWFFPEFSKIISISTAMVKDGRLILKSYSFDDEKELLTKFVRDIEILSKKKPMLRLCGHSLKTFKLPFIFKRCIVNGVRQNKLFDVGGVKPWEVLSLDTLELWKGTGSYASSIRSIALALDVDFEISLEEECLKASVEKSTRILIAEKIVCSVVNCVLKMMYEPAISKVEKMTVTDPEPEGVMQRIANLGEITEKDESELLEKIKQLSWDEKEVAIRLVKASLAKNGKKLPEDLELKMLM